MKFDNSYAVIRVQMQKRLLAIVVAVIVALLYTTNIWNYVEKWTDIPRYVGTIVFVAIFFTFYIYHVIAASSFIFYNDEEGKIIVRFYQLNMFNTSKNSFEIPKSEFEGFSLKASHWGLRKNLFLYRKYQGKTVKYPPVSLSNLSEPEIKKLLGALATHGPLLK